MSKHRNSLTAIFVTSLLAACSASSPEETLPDSEGDVGDLVPLAAADESKEDNAIAGALVVGEYARVCNASTLNQRSGAGTSYSILRALPEASTVKLLAKSGTWYQNDWGGKIGWSSGTYLCAVNPPPTPSEPAASFSVTSVNRSSIVAIAKASVGFSYFWGGAKFDNGANFGACYGNCPSCDHQGAYGADCSGFVAKAWLLPAALPMGSNKHPYSTASFMSPTSNWSDISRSSLKQGDALVYRSGGSGHIVLYDKGDSWGSFWTYEARGCSYGIVHNLRSVTSEYKAIKRSGV